jgi:hemolysin III
MPDRLSPARWRVPDARQNFPSYTAAESMVDRVVHLVGLAAAAVAIGWLLARIGPDATRGRLAAVSIYCCGLVGMLSASALYNLVRPSRLKAVLRRIDHAMIFVMIAASYTPFLVSALRPRLGVPFCAVVWGFAAIGIGLKLAGRYRNNIPSLALYFGIGWLGLGVLPSLWAVLPGAVLLLLLLGGLVYSLGALVHARARMPFHNAVWHAMVVIAAALHFAAVAQLAAGQG